MALDPRIALAGRVTDVGTALATGQQTGERFRTAGVRERLLDQSAEINQLALQQSQQQQAATQGAYVNQLATGLMSKPLDERAAIMAQQLPALTQLGLNPADILGSNLSDEGLRAVITQTQPFMQAQQQQLQPTAGMQEFQFFQNIINDPNASPDAVKSARMELGLDARQGRLTSVSLGNNVYADRDPNTGKLVNPHRLENGQKVELTPDEQLELRLAEKIKVIEEEGAAKTSVAVSESEQLGEVELETAKQGREQVAGENFIADLSERNQKAARSQIKLTEAFTLAQAADQGLEGVAKLKLSRLPFMQGIDVADSAALDSALKGLALEQLQTSFTGPTTDFEFGVVQDVSGDLMGSKQANLARIASLQRAAWFQQKEFEQARAFTENGGNPIDFKFNFQEIVPLKKGNYTLEQIQFTAARNHMTIEGVIELLNK